MMVSLDGYFEGPDHDLSWHNANSREFDDFANVQTAQVGAILFGRRTYDMMAGFWPSPEGIRAEPTTARLMNEASKFVFSHTLIKTAWEHTTLVSEDAAAAVRTLKAEPGRDIAIYGSNALCVSLMKEGLVDEFRLMMNPVAIGKGTPLFAGLAQVYHVTLLAERRFTSGNVLLTYEPKQA